MAFLSEASNLVPGDTNGKIDVFVRDRQSGATTRVSMSSAGAQANNGSFQAAISADGRYVAFSSEASNLVPDDTSETRNVFVRDRRAGTTTRVSVSSAGAQAANESFAAAISADGRYVAFLSEASNLVPGDTNGAFDVFVRDRQASTTARVSVSGTGAQANGHSLGSEGSQAWQGWQMPAISADGRYVVFSSEASNLVPGDTNATNDVFVRDRRAGGTSRVSMSSAGAQVGSESLGAAISADGRYVAFSSVASNLVPGDTNGTSDVFVRDRVG